MVTLYTTPSCTSCRKARAWLTENQIDFVERNMFAQPLSFDEIKKVLRMTEEGTDDIISFKSKAFRKLNVDLHSLHLQELYKIITENPSILRRPIIQDDKRLNVGFNEEEIRSFLPRKVRDLIRSNTGQIADKIH
jgi:regulatory protein spx